MLLQNEKGPEEQCCFTLPLLRTEDDLIISINPSDVYKTRPDVHVGVRVADRETAVYYLNRLVDDSNYTNSE